MSTTEFPSEVISQLKWYVYRLIDPRNGETFYVGKGKGNRIFAHAAGESADKIAEAPITQDSEDKEDDVDLKLQRIRDIRSVGLEVSHVIHRHGIDYETVAYEVEAALIDAYPGLTNKVAGLGSGDYGSRHVEEIIIQYAAKEFEVHERLILIAIHNTFGPLDAYDAVRCAWRINVNRARGYNLVLGHRQGLVVGAFQPDKWLPATRENFPGLFDVDFINPESGSPTRWGFTGIEAEPEKKALMLGNECRNVTGVLEVEPLFASAIPTTHRPRPGVPN